MKLVNVHCTQYHPFIKFSSNILNVTNNPKNAKLIYKRRWGISPAKKAALETLAPFSIMCLLF